MVTIGGTVMGSAIVGNGGSFGVIVSVKGGSMVIIDCTISSIALWAKR